MEPKHYINEIDLLVAAGVTLGLDFDNALEWSISEIDVKTLGAYIVDHAEAIARELRWRSERDRQVFSGGPYDGLRHCCGLGYHITAYRHVCRAKWAVYCRPSPLEPRMFFCGFATSKKAANKLAYQTLKIRYNGAGCCDDDDRVDGQEHKPD